MKKVLMASVALSSVLLLVGCGGGSSSSDSDDNDSGIGAAGPAEAGIYKGRFTLNDQEANTIMLLAPDGGLTLYNGNAEVGTYISGDLEFAGDRFTGDFSQFGGYNSEGDYVARWTQGTLEGDSFVNAIDGSAYPESGESAGAAFQFVRDPDFSSYKGANADLEGVWTDATDASETTSLSINADGTIADGSDAFGCTLSGGFEDLDPTINIYSVSLVSEGCDNDASKEGTLSGYAHFNPNNDNLIVLVDDNQSSDAVPYRRYVFSR